MIQDPARVYIAPMRLGVLWLCTQYEVWAIEDLVVLAAVARTSARMYCTQLRDRLVVREVDRSMFTRAKGFKAWSKERPRTRPGGDNHMYLHAKADRDAHYMEDVDARRILGDQIRRARIAMGWTLHELEVASGVAYRHLSRAELGEKGLGEGNLERVRAALLMGAET